MTSAPQRYRVGVIGYGGIGRGLVDFLTTDERFELAFLYNRTTPVVSAELAPLLVTDLDRAEEYGAQLIVEASHPDHTVRYGEQILTHANYLPVSTSALADDDLLERLTRTASAHGTQLLLPRGALVGLDSLVSGRDLWKTVSITFRKHPSSLENADGVVDTNVSNDEEKVLYEGTVRGIADLYPRNVNSMITLAIATKGLDDTHAVLIADPHETRGILEVEAIGHDGSRLLVRREQPMQGVSGTEMFGSILGSVRTAADEWSSGLRFV